MMRYLKPAIAIFVVLLLSLFSDLVLKTIQANPIGEDEFNDGTIDSELWTIQEPFGDSDVFEQDGYAQLVNRGRIISRFTLPAQNITTIIGRFRYVGSAADSFNVHLRTDVDSLGSSGQVSDALSINFTAPATGPPFDVAIELHEGSTSIASASTSTFPLAMNTFYNFKIVDDGLDASLFINDFTTPILSISNPIRFGDLLAFNNREGAGGGSGASAGSHVQVDFMRVTSVPEPSTALLAMLALFGLTAFRLHSHSRI